MPEATTRGGLAPAMSLPSNSIDPGTRRNEPGDRAQRGALAGAVGADQGDELPGLDLQRNAAQRRDAAIAAHHVADLKHVSAPCPR